MNKHRVWSLSLVAFPFALLGVLLFSGALFQLNAYGGHWVGWPLAPFHGEWGEVWPLYVMFLYAGLPLAIVVYVACWGCFAFSKPWPWGGHMGSLTGGLWWSLGYLGLAWVGMLNSLVLLLL